MQNAPSEPWYIKRTNIYYEFETAHVNRAIVILVSKELLASIVTQYDNISCELIRWHTWIVLRVAHVMQPIATMVTLLKAVN